MDDLHACVDPALAQCRQDLLDALARHPGGHDFFALLRRMDMLWPEAPRQGAALRPAAEPLRFGQDPELDFAPTAVSSFELRAKTPPRVGVRFFGLFGPMGPLPLHVTEYARERLKHHGDATTARFADVFHHRMLLLFYRAWAQTQPTVQADRPADDRYAKWIAAWVGQAPPVLRDADSVPAAAKRHVAAHLARPTRSAEAIEKVLRQYFSVPIRIDSHIGHWMTLRPADRTRVGDDGLGRGGARLGVSAVAGSKVWDHQYKLRVRLGALTLCEYLRFLPGAHSLIELRDWLRQLVGFEMFWELRLVLRADEVPPLALSGQAALGLTTWLGSSSTRSRAGELTLQATQLSTQAHPTQEQAHG